MDNIYGETPNQTEENGVSSFVGDATRAMLSSSNQNVAPVSSSVNVNAVPSLNDILSSLNQLEIGSPSRSIPRFVDASNAAGGFSPSCNYLPFVDANATGGFSIRNPSFVPSPVHHAQFPSYEDMLRMRAPPQEGIMMVPPQNHQGQYNYFNPLCHTRASTLAGNSIDSKGGIFAYANSSYPSYVSGIHLNSRYSSETDLRMGSTDYLETGLRMSLNDWLARIEFWDKQLSLGLSQGKPDLINKIFLEIKDFVRDLMVDQYGNRFIQKFFTICSEYQMVTLISNVFSDGRRLLAICANPIGTRVVQKMLEHLTTRSQKCQVLTILRCLTLNLSKGLNSHHVIKYCLMHFTDEETKCIQHVLADNCMELATDRNGCVVLQVCVQYKHGEHCDRILAELAANALILSEHPYGNYVVSLLVMIRRMQTNILSQLKGSYVSLSMNKHASNVVEQCLKGTRGFQQEQIIIEMMNDHNFLRVLQDPFGNYVAQTALEFSTGGLRNDLVDCIHRHSRFLQCHPHGKRVLAATKRSVR